MIYLDAMVWFSRLMDSSSTPIYGMYLLYIILQSRNWDGGYQEFNTAASCVKNVFPGADIVQDCVNVYPIRVIVTAHLNGKNIEVWSGRQQSLFSKYYSEREKSMSEITELLEGLKSDFDL